MSRREGYVYLLKSMKDGTLYFGSTNDINRRISEHNDGKSASTRYRTPWQLIAVIRFDHISHARKTEQVLKSYKERLTTSWFLETIAKWERNFEG